MQIQFQFTRKFLYWMIFMTTASELYYSRRYRFNHRHTSLHDDDPPFDSFDSSSSHQHRPGIRRHTHHSRRINRHRIDQSEHEAVQPEQGVSQSPSGSIINSDDFRSIQRRRSTERESDRLPGSVLLARERLVERLSGVSVSGNSLIGTQNNPLEIRNERREEMASESRQVLLPTRNYPSGLAQDAINCLKLEVFNEKTDKINVSRECTICLEYFKDGDKLIRMHCMHRFHPSCLFPWVRVCGACPNCRKPILENVPMK